jgi:uncharacterized protein RhaS with RHS repeats
VQSDPIGLSGGNNTYGYVSSSPLQLVDPYGLLEHFMFELNGKAEGSLECACGEKYRAFSGNGAYRNQPDATSVKDNGPLPEGTYYIVDRPRGGPISQAAAFVTGKSKWFALYRDDGSVGDSTSEKGVARSEIRLHPGSRSYGCMTLKDDVDFDHLRNRLLKTSTGTIPGTNIKYYGTVLVYRPSNGW